jgi:hypothetical protein
MCLKAAWKSFKMSLPILGDRKAENCSVIVVYLLQSYRAMGCNTYLTVHFLDSHLVFFPEYLGALSNEHSERFHQDKSTMKQPYQGKGSCIMLADYYRAPRRNDPQAKYSRNSSTLIV